MVLLEKNLKSEDLWPIPEQEGLSSQMNKWRRKATKRKTTGKREDVYDRTARSDHVPVASDRQGGKETVDI